MNSVVRSPSTVASGELDLFNVLRTLWRRRLLIVGFGGVCALVGAAAAYNITPVYEASTSLRPVALNQLDALNRTEIYSLPPEVALKKVGATLDSYNARLDFFRSRPDLIDAFQDEGQSVEQAFEDFNRDALSVVLADPKKNDLLSDFIGLKMRYEKGVNGAAILNDFVDYAIERERSQLSKDMQIILANRLAEVDKKMNSAVSEYEAGNESRIARLEEADAIKRAQLNDELKALRVQLKLSREARLGELDEAISVARSLGLKKPSTPSLMADEGAANGNIIRTEVNGRPVPLYFMGTEVLEAERAALRKRTSDDFVEPRIGQIRKELILLSTNRKVQAIKGRSSESAFLEGIEGLRVERARLQAIDTRLEGLHLVSIDQRAVPSSKPVKPRKALIVLIASIVGLLLGTVTALLRGVFKDQARQQRALEVERAAHHVIPNELAGRNHAKLGDAQA
ncbi:MULTISPECIES: Wzz/FepE/Etk N-terminal domain-containing protein [Pseudomonas]|uniref:Wzz/FepE/Etk N-terminal domain-containing protein n=1 Tax=Pseudomonas TaxID=286 RepID=UPI001E3C5C95|nr:MULTISPECIES: Wzz/FepE/Etk N-terminal domain-containing protein [Pseudomonas]MCE0852043.1 Wzz/FepE/Etk N-terminal domain-containing protein [Pseudomonas asiatica]MDD2026184.1 Wzz/FepE/Etk N-terminal domain-containing protein [Pseudomonas putida]WPU62767.1 Wzz/FepE/Etk N-terminal domain-containing protein [Pseudomonas asiatica]CAB5637727.1 LPS O-antigen length regulator [Pseudomonas putida]CAB5638473.1 LPS O-antigen length regulator [Pseudomonas putida]